MWEVFVWRTGKVIARFATEREAELYWEAHPRNAMLDYDQALVAI